MTTPNKFWKLLQESGLLPSEQLSDLHNKYQKIAPSKTSDVNAISKWLIKQQAITVYQAHILLKGRKGPFNFGHYQVQDRIPAGPLKGWFQAHHHKTKHAVILHFLTGDECQQPRFFGPIIRRIKTFAALRNPYIWRVFDLVHEPSYRCVVLQDEIIRSPKIQSLTQRMATTARLNEVDACSIAWQIAQALDQLHQRGLVYGHLTPNSIWLNEEGQVKLLPFFDQIHRPLNLPADEENQALVLAADYMAPELQLPDANLNITTDIYSLGAILYLMLTGMQPFPGGSIKEKMTLHANEPIADLSAYGVSKPITQLTNYMMAKQTATRYQSASEVADKLATVLPSKMQSPPQHSDLSQSSLEFEAAITAESTILDATPLPPPPVRSTQPVATAATPVPQIQVTLDNTSDQSVTSKEYGANEPSNDNAAPSFDSDNTSVGPRNANTTARRRRQSNSPWMNPVLWIGLAAGLIGVAALVIILEKPTDPQQNTTTTDNGGSTAGDTTNTNNGNGGNENGNTVPAETGGSQFITDDGQSLWQSPTSGNAINLAWSPPAGQLFIAIQVEELLKSTVADDVLKSLGPAFQKHLSTWEATTGFKLQDIKQLLLSWRDEEGVAFPTVSMVVHLKSEATAQQILETLGNPAAEETEHGTIYQASTWTYLVPESGGLFVMGTKSAMTSTLELKGNPPLIRRTLTQLIKQSDRERHLTILFAPSFLSTTLFRDGHEFYFGEPSKIREPLQWLLGNELEAAMVSLHFDSVLYIESRMTAGLTVDKRELVTQLRDRMGELHDKIEAHMVTLNPSPYWRALAFRFPAMVAFLHEQTRIQIEDNTPVLNIALPIQAASNLIIASELSLASEPSAGGVAVSNEPMLPKTIEEVLQYSFSVDIPQQDLNLAIADIANEVRSSLAGLPFKFGIDIAGNDLMQDGITRNQAIRDFTMKDKPLAEVLTGIVMKANPDPTVTSPSMSNQKLIWLITTDPNDPGNKIILITTRKAAAANKYTLPAVFVE
ncbi:MAG: serine/threonine protein kinase [Planctomycetaceae bacterium]|jgi:eukaryotic-like serine/threonine-protein kinase|nr:serine/threonine protein kinase [Planctomycetaceae bacterium]